MRVHLRFFAHYVRSRKYVFFSWGMFLGLLCIFSYLFPESKPFFIYFWQLLLLSAVFFFTFDGYSCYRSWNRCRQGEEVTGQSPLEMLLSAKLKELKEDGQQKQAVFLNKEEERLDYFTLWVHQIKTPITASYLLIKSISDPSLQKQLHQELFKIERYSRLVLEYLRLESFHEDLVLKEENIKDMVHDVVKQYSLLFIHKNISLSLEDLDYCIVTDKKWFATMIEQILSNSLKYTSKGRIRFFIKGSTLYISDTGIGIRQSDVKRVFERGFSGYNGRQTQQSSGLGLYLTKRIANQLGFVLSLTSTVGEGTCLGIDFSQLK